jgi:hypothetical protein
VDEPKLVKRLVEEEYELKNGYAKGVLSVKDGAPYGVSIGLGIKSLVFNVSELDSVIECLQAIRRKSTSLTKKSCTHPQSQVSAMTRVGISDDSWHCQVCDATFRENPSR